MGKRMGTREEMYLKEVPVPTESPSYLSNSKWRGVTHRHVEVGCTSLVLLTLRFVNGKLGLD